MASMPLSPSDTVIYSAAKLMSAVLHNHSVGVMPRTVKLAQVTDIEQFWSHAARTVNAYAPDLILAITSIVTNFAHL